MKVRELLLGGILPIIVYTVVEEVYGTWWGLIAGMGLGIAEICYEYATQKKVSGITWAGNLLLLTLGGIALTTSEGIWFKLQPAILELAMGGFLLGSVAMKKPLMTLMAEKQGLFGRFPAPIAPLIRNAFRVLTLRLGVFFLLHAALATYAAFHWSTRAWALLKGVGFTGSMIVYVLFEGIRLRRQVRRAIADQGRSSS